MKICVVGPTFPYRGGISHYSTLLVRHLRKMGHETIFYSYTRQYPRWLFPGKSDHDPSATPLREDCEYVLDPTNPFSWWRLCRRIRADKPDIVVLQWWVPYWTPTLTFISRWLKKHTPSHIVYICHNVTPHDGGGILDRRLALTALRQGDSFIVHSEQDLYRLKALLPDATAFRTQLPTYEALNDHVPVQNSAILRQELGIPDDHHVILFFGFVRPYKGLEYLIQALPLVRKQMPVHLLVVGEFWAPIEFYQRYAEQSNVTDAITIVNRYVSNEELGLFFDLAEVVVLPYVSATQSAVVQLAYGFGTPVITTRVGGLHEVVQDGVTGLVVPPQDQTALAGAIVRYFRDEMAQPLRQAIAEQHSQQRFAWNGLVTLLEEINASIAGRR